MLGELPTLVKVAREQAILGLYQDSLGKFREAVGLIDTHVSSGEARGLEDQWRKARRDLSEEIEAVNKVLSALQRFKFSKDSQSYSNMPPPEPSSGAFPIEISNPSYRGEPQFNRFNQAAPFAQHPGYDADPYDQARQVSGGDPDVWPPPTPQVDRIQPRAVAKRKQPVPSGKDPPRKNVLAKVAGAKVPSEPPKAGRNYEKPWKVNAKNEEQKVPQGERSAFMDAKFPDGATGPDIELIQMLEHDVLEQSPSVTFDDIAELQDAKQLLEEAVLLPIIMPEYFQGIRKPWKGILLFGPPGTGKTMLAKAVATLGKTTFFNVSSSTLASKWRGESEKLVRLLFDMARFYAPATVFFDEVDGLGSKRGEASEHEASRRVKNELLTQMDGVGTEEGKHIVIIAATNRPWDLDEALRRRLEKRIYIPLPQEVGRKRLFEIYTKGVDIGPGVDWNLLVKSTDGYSGSDISSLCRDAAMMPIRRKMAELRKKGLGIEHLEKNKDEMQTALTMIDFRGALSNVQKSVSNEDLERYSQWMATFGSSV